MNSYSLAIVGYRTATIFHGRLSCRKRVVHQDALTALIFCIGLWCPLFGEDGGLSILVIGDSNTEHGYITLALADSLGKFFTPGTSGTGYIPLNSSFYAIRYSRYKDITIRYPAAWTCRDMFEGTRLATLPYLSPNGHWLTSSQPDAVATVQFPGNGIDVYWLSESNGGMFSITIDDSIYDTISTNGLRAVHKTSLEGLVQDEKHTVLFTIISVPAQGTVTLLGFDVHEDRTDKRKRSVVHNWGNGYCTTADFLNIDSTVFVSGLQQCNPDVVVVLLGTNDHLQDRRSAPEFKANCKALINRIKASGVTTNILLTSTFMTSETTGATYLPAYLATSWPEAASETGIEYWDMCTWFGPYKAARMNGSVHCNANGGKLIAGEMLNQILQRFSVTPSRSRYVAPPVSPSYAIHCTSGKLIVEQQNNLPYQIGLVNLAGRRIASLQGFGSHGYRLGTGDVTVNPGIGIATLYIDGHTIHCPFTVTGD